MVIKIEFPKPVAPSRTEAKRRTNATGSTVFSSLLDAAGASSEPATTDAVATAAPMVGVGSLLGLQEVSEAEVERKRTVRHGRSLLDTLDALRDGLLAGSLSASTIRQLEALLAEKRRTITDPALLSLMDDIELRAAVELAKLEMAGLVAPRNA